MKKGLSVFLAILLFGFIFLSFTPPIKTQPAAPSFWLEPTTLNFNTTTTQVDDTFNVTLYVATSGDTFTYQYGVLYDTTQLNCTAASYTGGPAVSQFFKGHTTTATGPLLDYQPGEVYGGETLLGSDVVHANTTGASIITMTFQIIASPSPGGNLTSVITANSADTFLLDPNLDTVTGVSFGDATFTYTSTQAPTVHEVVVSSVTPASASVTQGTQLSISVVVLNNGTASETFGVNATYNGILIGNQTVTSLSAGSTQTLTYTWNTTGVAVGNYTITATVTPVVGQTDLTNISQTTTVQVLAVPPVRHDVVVSSISALSTVNQGDTLSITVVALNNGTVTETFTVNATYGATLIGTQTVTSLAAGSTQTLTFSWNTTGVAVGNYTITATVTPVAGQTDLTDISQAITVQVLTPPPTQHDVVVSSVTPASASVTQGAMLSINVIVLNNGTVTESSFAVNVTYDGTLIGTQTVTSLAAGSDQTLTFSWNTTGVAVGSYTITATVTPVVGQTDLTNISQTTTVQVLAVPARHDVVVSSVTAASTVPQGSSLSIDVAVLNNGTVTESSFAVNVTYDSTLIGTQTVSSLAAGTTLPLAFTWNTTGVAAGSYTITATVTPVVGQTDLTNISMTTEVQVLALPPTRHEVAVTGITAAPNPVNQSGTVSISVTVLNNGTAAETFDVNVTYNGILIGDQTVTSLSAGSTQTLSFSWTTTSVAAGNYALTATATPVAGQTDLSSISQTTTVQVLAVPAARHDLVLSSVSSSATVTQGAQLSINVTVLNNGTVTESSFAVNVTYDSTLIGTQTVESLAAGATQTLTFNWFTEGVTVGYYTVTATVTPALGQTDLSGISKSMTVQVQTPLIPVYAVTFTETGLPGTFQWTVTFNGQTNTSTSSSITFYAQNGAYPFSVTGPTNFAASPTGGTVTVNGQNVTVTITFVYFFPPVHDVVIQSIAAFPNPVTQGNTVSIAVVVLNNGNSLETSLTVNVTYDGTLIAKQIVASLVAGGQQGLSFSWDTTGVTPGYYTLTATVAPVPGQTNLSNISKTATVQIEAPTVTVHFALRNLSVILIFFVPLDVVGGSVFILFLALFRKKGKRPARRYSVRVVG